MRYLIVRKSLAERIAARRPPPQAAPQPTVPDRQEWQRNYIKQSQSGTDIHSATGNVGDSGIKQEQMNAMSPADRLAHLQKIARQQPIVPHYHVLPTGQVAWGHGGAGTRPVRPGERLLAHREPMKPPVEVRVDSHVQTHLGRGMRVIHPDGNHEEMHGQPLHPMTVATQRQVPPRPALLKSLGARKRRKPARKHHTPRHGMEGRDQHGHDIWYHAGYLLAHEPSVARSCGLHREEGQIEDGGIDAPASDGGEAMEASLSASAPVTGTGKRRIQHPGARGGKFYYDEHGDVVYGERPAPHFRQAMVGDHVMTGRDHSRVHEVGDGHLGVTYTGTGRTAAVGPGEIGRMAPAHLHGSELPPDMADAYDSLGGEEHDPGNAGELRRRMARQPLPGDRLALQHGGDPLEVQGQSGDDVALRDQSGGDHVMARPDWERSVRETGVPHRPNFSHSRRGSALMEAEGQHADPVHLAAAAMRDRMAGDEAMRIEPDDTSGDHPRTAALRAEMRRAAYPGDVVAVVAPLWLDGNSYDPGTSLTVTWVDNGEPEMYDGLGKPVASLSRDEWQNFVGQNAVVPQRRGDPPPDEDDPQVPGEGVFGVFEGRVSKQEVAAAWTGQFSGGYSTTVDTMAEGTGKVAVTGSILNPEGVNVGYFERTLHRDGRGNITAEHSIMNVQQKMSVGFAQDFNAQAEERYRQWGVGKITLYANISVGKYCWAKQGYDFTSPDERDGLIARFGDFCKSQGHPIPAADLARFKHSWDIAGYDTGAEVPIYGYRLNGEWLVGGDFPLGKAFMLADPDYTEHASGGWHGVKVLT